MRYIIDNFEDIEDPFGPLELEERPVVIITCPHCGKTSPTSDHYGCEFYYGNQT